MSRPARSWLQWPATGGVWVVLLLALALEFPYFERTRNANERPRLMQAMAWVDADEWAIDGVAARGLDAGPDTARSGVDGRLYPNKPPGTTIVAAAGYRVARALHGDALDLRTLTFWARLFAGVLPTLALAWLLWRRHAPVFGFGPAMAAVLTWALATPAIAYGHLLYGHALAACALHAGILAIAWAREREDPRRWPWLLLGGALAGASIGVEYMAAFAGIPIGAVLLLAIVRAEPWRRRTRLLEAAAALGGAIVPVAMLATYHQRVFGSPWSTGYLHATVADFAAAHGQGLMGLTAPSWTSTHAQFFAVDAGLLWWAPAVVLGGWGLLMAGRDPARRFEAQLHIGIIVVFVWMNASLAFDGGWRVGPRYFALALPSFVLGWAECYAQLRRSPPWITIAVALVTYGIVVDGLAANLWPHIDVDNVDAPVPELLLPLLEGGLRPWLAFGRVSTHDPLLGLLALSVVTFALVFARVMEPGIRTWSAALAGIVLALAMVGAHGWLPRHPRGARNLAYVESVWEPKGATARSVALPELTRPVQPRPH